MRGGIAVISGRYARANNKYMDDLYNPNSDSSYILSNNLYGYSMVQKLPVGGFRWLEGAELDVIDTDSTR